MTKPFLEVRDASDTEQLLAVGSQRIVSLVPSITESVIGIGAGGMLVGRTRYCIHPAAEVTQVAKVGGTKDPDLGRIVALAPDVVLANREENRPEHVAALREAGLKVWVGEPKTVEDALRLVAFLGNLTDHVEEAAAIVVRGEAIMAQLASYRQHLADQDALRVKPRGLGTAVAFIWREPWMVAGGDTFISDMMQNLGWLNGFATQGRYPTVELDDPRVQGARLVFLPSEPYAFGEADEAFLRTACPRVERIVRCCGEDLMWAGTRTPDALLRLHRQLSAPRPAKSEGPSHS